MASITVQVAARLEEAAEVVSLELRPVDGPTLPPFAAGAHIDLHVSPGLVRQYSLYERDPQDRRYAIAVLREPRSRGGSVAIHDRLKAGDLVQISAPRNHFELVPGRPALLFAGGIGITPILCMAQELHRSGLDFAMHYCARSIARAAFHGYIAAAGYRDRVRLHLDDGPAAQKLHMAQVLQDADRKAHLYVCGPAGFIDHVVSSARAEDWPASQIHFEHFAPATPPQAGGRDTAFDVRIASTGQLITVGPDQSVTAALANRGIAIAVACEQGVCGTCVTRVLEGEPEHRDMYLTPQEQARNDQFTPCCSRARSPLLVLDL